MPKKLTNKRSVEQDHLRKLQAKGAHSLVLDARLKFKEADGFARYAKIMQDMERVYPHHLPTQASGRWSTTDPPLVNFPPSLADAIMPDEGTYWLHWDWRGIEATLAYAYSGDEAALEAIRKQHDIHTITCCQMFKHELPPDLRDPHACTDWIASWTPAWTGKEDRRRHLAKTGTYAMIYGVDERAMLAAKDVEKLGLTREELLAGGRAILASKPALVAWKHKVWKECATSGVSYTFLGRRRRLFGDWWERAKMGLNHRIQGAVADMMNLCLADIILGHKELGGWLVVNKHDGAILAFPSEAPASVSSQGAEHTLAICQASVHRTWQIEGTPIAILADWKLTNDQGITMRLGAL